jgi:lipid-binding SYLF domain-containing protein
MHCEYVTLYQRCTDAVAGVSARDLAGRMGAYAATNRLPAALLLSRRFPRRRQRKPAGDVLLSLDRELPMIRKLLPLGIVIAIAAGQLILAASTDESDKHAPGNDLAAGAVVGHEVGHQHVGAGAATGALIGHHDKNTEKRQ